VCRGPSQAFNIEQTNFTIDSVKDTITTVDAMKAASKTLKTEFKKVNIDKIDDLQDELADMMEDMNEVQDVLGRSYDVGEDVDEADLDAELDALGDELEVDDECVPRRLVGSTSLMTRPQAHCRHGRYDPRLLATGRTDASRTAHQCARCSSRTERGGRRVRAPGRAGRVECVLRKKMLLDSWKQGVALEVGVSVAFGSRQIRVRFPPENEGRSAFGCREADSGRLPRRIDGTRGKESKRGGAEGDQEVTEESSKKLVAMAAISGPVGNLGGEEHGAREPRGRTRRAKP